MPQSRSTRSPRKPKARSGRSGWRVLTSLVLVALMLGALQNGLWTRPSELIAEHVGGSTTDDGPTKQPAKKSLRQQRRKDGQ